MPWLYHYTIYHVPYQAGYTMYTIQDNVGENQSAWSSLHVTGGTRHLHHWTRDTTELLVSRLLTDDEPA